MFKQFTLEINKVPLTKEEQKKLDLELYDLCQIKNISLPILYASIKNGANLDAYIGDCTIFEYCLINKMDKKYIEFFLKNGVDINKKLSNNNTYLHRAIEFSTKEIVEILLLDPNIDTSIIFFGMDYLQYALYKKADISIIRLLLPITKNINRQSSNGATALHTAVLYKTNQTIKIISLLIENGALLNIKKNGNKTVLDYARKYNAGDLIINFLITKGSIVNDDIYYKLSENIRNILIKKCNDEYVYINSLIDLNESHNYHSWFILLEGHIQGGSSFKKDIYTSPITYEDTYEMKNDFLKNFDIKSFLTRLLSIIPKTHTYQFLFGFDTVSISVFKK